MSDSDPLTEPGRRAPREAPRRTTPAPSPSGSSSQRARTAAEIAALVQLAGLDAALLSEVTDRRTPAYDERIDERRGLGARISPGILEAYDRALRAGRQPAVVRLVASVCSGCNMRLHSTLDQIVRKRRGAAPCPHCLRVVYDPSWLEGA